MKAGINYSDGERMHSSDRFLSKDELRKIFGPGVDISLTMTYSRKRIRKGHFKDGHAAVKKGYPVFRQKGREYISKDANGLKEKAKGVSSKHNS